MLHEYPGYFKLVRTGHETPRIRNPEQALEGNLATVPTVGEPLTFIGEGRYISTSTVVSISWLPDGFQAETLNSVYGVKLNVSLEALKALEMLSTDGYDKDGERFAS